MRDQWEAQIGAIENIQEEFGHDIREIKERLVRLTSLFEDMAIHPRGPSPLPHQQVLRPSVQTTSYPPRGTDRLTYGNQGLQLRLLLGQHFDLLIGQTAQKAN